MERISSAQPPPSAPRTPGMSFPVFVYNPRRGVKRDDSKETYKLPHRLIEKKRRDRINECIAQLKELLPEHLKLTTLGHLEKAVVLELTLKHVRALSSLLEQQRQKILTLQQDLQLGDHGGGAEIFRSGFDLCANEVLQYLSGPDGGGDLSPSRVIAHIHKVAADILRRGGVPRPEEPVLRSAEEVKPARVRPPRPAEGPAKNCVPVIQRTCPNGAGEQSGSDTDTDSGYGGGDQDKRESRAPWAEGLRGGGQPKPAPSERTGAAIKQEGDEPHAKRPRSDPPGDDVQMAAGPGSYVSFPPPSHAPFCLPFYLLPPPAAAAYLPMLEKCWFPGGVPVVYPGASVASLSPESPSSLVMSPREASPVPTHTPPTDSAALLQA